MLSFRAHVIKFSRTVTANASCESCVQYA